MTDEKKPAVTERPLDELVRRDSYDEIQDAFNAGLLGGEKYLKDMFAKFGTLVPTPGNKFKKGTEEFRAWGDGFAEAIRDWFDK